MNTSGPVSVASLTRQMAEKKPIVCITAYDYPTGLAVRAAGAEICLVGDSLANVALGHSSTRSLSLEAMIHHSTVVRDAIRANDLKYDSLCPPEPLLVVDMPFGTCEVSIEDATRNVLRVVQATQAQAVKIEGSRELVPLVEKLATYGISVMAHVGLQPQRFGDAASLRVQAARADSAFKLFEDVLALQEAGSFAILLECVPSRVAETISEHVSIPVIGIGAGPHTHGQVLVGSDLVADLESPVHVSAALRTQPQDVQGVDTPTEWPAPPKFVRSFAPMSLGALRIQAFRAFADAVRARTFPEVTREAYRIKSEELAKFRAMLEARHSS
ncbi:3-methyl-2-oxobutanoate hydroxymethyltransferase [Malassezia furfur]|uniref:3-methyl-2-oxobutanoate hydroxymethyltransferase n=1 Tax=Malassezia furfur TaxID=55194 RepID=A0ABY8ERN5_MALFU|nr:ECM31 [Malassezia furfur]WFD48247.1 3-methyl-2-oxobutanoate hydroxymethyltransferase [Malassezia furfur]